jgi:hypothetical protein
MSPEPVPADPGRDEDLAWLDRDPERETWLDRAREHDEPPWDEEDAYFPELTPDELAGIREAAADELLAVEAATTGRRGPGQPGSARVFPGESSSPAAGFGPGMPLDVLPGCAGLALSADAAGEDDGFAGVSEGELVGVVCAWDRVEAHAAARKLAAIAELARRNPEPGDAEFTADELANALAESRTRAYALLGTADHLDTHLPGTRAALRDGTISMSKAQIIANATGLLDPAEARAAELEVLDRAARSVAMIIGSSSTPGGRSTSSPTAPSAGPPQRGGPTPPNPPVTPSDRDAPGLQPSGRETDGSRRLTQAAPFCMTRRASTAREGRRSLLTATGIGLMPGGGQGSYSWGNPVAAMPASCHEAGCRRYASRTADGR